MKVDDIIKIAAAIIASLGGGAAIITAVAKWCGDILAQKLFSNIEHEHEKEIEKYKTNLQDMSAKFTALVQHSMEVASKQYDMEVKIYQNIWRSLYELSACQSYIYDFEHPIVVDSEEYIRVLTEHNLDFKVKLECFQKQIDSEAPFYQSNTYNLLCEINELYVELSAIFKKSTSITGMSSENANKVNTRIVPQICILKENLTKEIRDYLLSLKKVPGN